MFTLNAERSAALETIGNSQTPFLVTLAHFCSSCRIVYFVFRFVRLKYFRHHTFLFAQAIDIIQQSLLDLYNWNQFTER